MRLILKGTDPAGANALVACRQHEMLDGDAEVDQVQIVADPVLISELTASKYGLKFYEMVSEAESGRNHAQFALASGTSFCGYCWHLYWCQY
jgi:hypothetical protein